MQLMTNCNFYQFVLQVNPKLEDLNVLFGLLKVFDLF